MTRAISYDFTDAADFLREYDLANLYEDVVGAMSTLSHSTKYIGREEIHEVWLTLLACADFIDSIKIK